MRINSLKNLFTMGTKMTNKYLFIIILIFFLFSVQSCFILKPPLQQKTLNLRDINDSIKNKIVDFDTLSFKMLIRYTSKTKSYTLYSNINMIKDSIIVIRTFLPLGINVADILLSPDTVLIYFPIQNSYSAGKKSYFLNNYNLAINFTSIQSILTGEFFPYPYFSRKGLYKFHADSVYHFSNKIYNKRNKKLISVQSDFSYNTAYLLKYINIDDFILKRNLFVNYVNYKKIDNFYFPSVLNLQMSSVSDTLSIKMKIKSVKFHSNSKFIIKIPKNAKIIN